ncbi:X-box-binding protein 1 [Galendromus occidentalis]|uniref:X-box-binding protein 1 n=1 Tax=Galendromus occidentalis TaxID=34638 RepID=A0AAJ6VYN7_9ACAR|nr:X-box-binding protein 1 [Galendromus occidentalis]
MLYSDSSMDVLDAAVRVSGLRGEAGSAGAKPTRKRQKLDHLTSEEKLLRRKMKNRAAAQNARDRKKAHMDELEIQVTELIRDSKQLTAENERLRKVNAEQQKQIEELQARLAAVDSQKMDTTTEGSFEHASLVNEPLQKDQVPTVVLSLLLCVLLRLMSNAKTSTTTTTNSLTCRYSTTPTSSTCSSSSRHRTLLPPRSLQASWWTPHRLKT